MKKKVYVTPETDVLKVQLENMLAASIPVDNTPGDGLEGDSFDDGLNIWNN
ncbi:MAG: hypothetical protein K2N13_04430 [Paraprevotella sp.]|nr:hypothetical protein [Paraprevotella sp.]